MLKNTSDGALNSIDVWDSQNIRNKYYNETDIKLIDNRHKSRPAFDFNGYKIYNVLYKYRLSFLQCLSLLNIDYIC